MKRIAWLAAAAAYLLGPWMVDGKLFGLLFTSLWNKEIDYDTSRTPNAAIFDQAENRMHAQNGLLVELLG